MITQLIKFATSKFETGQIEEKYASQVLTELHLKLAHLKIASPKIQKLDLVEKIKSSQLTEIFGAEAVANLIKSQKISAIVVSPNQRILQKGTKCYGIYLIARGTVIEKQGPIEDVNQAQLLLHEGEILCLQNIVPHFGAAAISNVFTNKYAMATVVFLDISTLMPLLDNKDV